MPPGVRDTREGCVLDVTAVPGKNKTRIVSRGSDGGIIVHVKAPAEKDKANKALIRYMRRVFGDVTILSGHKSRKKCILVCNVPKEVVNRRLREEINKN